MTPLTSALAQGLCGLVQYQWPRSPRQQSLGTECTRLHVEEVPTATFLNAKRDSTILSVIHSSHEANAPEDLVNSSVPVVPLRRSP